jgi:hypothetical protein
MRFFNPLAVAFAVDTVISVNRIFLSVRSRPLGKRLIAFFASPRAAEAIKKSGMEPVASAK